MHWITRNPWADSCDGVDITFKNRHMPEFIPAKMSRTPDGDYIVNSSRQVQGIAPGQFGVIYNRDHSICLGSGIITGL